MIIKYLNWADSTSNCFGPIKADIGFIACNTAHHFFKDFQTTVQFELVNILETISLPQERVIFCSPTTKELQLFGKDAKYASVNQINEIGKLISRINNGEIIEDSEFKSIVGSTKLPVFACTELSMLAFKEKLMGIDTLEQTINEVIRRIKWLK